MRGRNSYFYERDLAYTRFFIPEGLDVLDIGCATGELLEGLKPRRGVGIDLSGVMIEIARSRYSQLEFYHVDAEAPAALDSFGTFDIILLSDTIGYLEDITTFFRKLRPLLKPQTRIVVSYYSRSGSRCCSSA